jgi:nitrous oxidase accessory protein NosD
MRTARFPLVLASLAALLLCAAPAWADTVSVPTDYKTIQEAIDAAARGDTVRVAAGVYAETVTIGKALTLCGAGAGQTIVDGGGTGHVIRVVSDDDIYIRDLTVRNGSTAETYAGIDLYVADGCVIEDCAFSDVWAGVRCTYAPENLVSRCTFTDVDHAVDVGDKASHDVWIVDCQAADCRSAAYNAYAGSDGLRILRCSAVRCPTGVQIGWSSSWVVECCDFVDDDNGVVVDTATTGVVRHCTFQENGHGLWVAGLGSSGNDVYGNLFTACTDAGIALQGAATGNLFHDNRLEGCAFGAFIMFHPSTPNEGNTFFRNGFRWNDLHAADQSGHTNDFSSSYPWGNYWDDAEGSDDYSGPDQDVPGPDGVFDKGYTLGACVDRYPATTPDEEAPSTTITSGPSGWLATRDVAFTWEGTDDRAPAECLAYRLQLDDDLPALDTVTGIAYEGLAEGEHTFSVAARDCMGHDDEDPATAAFGVDVSPPLTEDNSDTAWHQYDTTVYFAAWDKYSGVDHTEYSVDGGGSWLTGSDVTVAAPSDGSGDGVFTIWYRSVDVAGNVEEPRSCIVKITTQGFAFDHYGAPVGGAADRVNDVATADLDGDGDLDVIAGCGSGADAEIVAWENDGTPFDAGWDHVDVGTSADSVHSVAAADLDNDGDVDIVAGHGDTSTSLITGWQNDGTPFDGGWAQHAVGMVGSDLACHAEVALADLDADGWTDIVSVTSAYGGSGGLNIWQNTAAPWDAPWPVLSLWGAYSMGSVAILDLDGDPWPDIALSYNQAAVATFTNPGPPLSDSWAILGAGVGGPGMISAIAPADFTGDGRDDFATSIGYLPSCMQLVWVNPGGAAWPMMGYADIPATSVDAGDLDLDGVLDLFSGSHGAGPELLAHQGAGPSPWGGFSGYEVADLDAAVRDVTLADLDGDGDLDAVSGGDVSEGDEVLAWENLRLVDTADPWSWSTYDWTWQTRSVDLGIEAGDAGSGVRTIQYRVGERGPWADTPPSSLKAHKRGWAGGVFTLQFRAIDNAGNVEPANSLTMLIDRRAPVTTDDHDDAEWSSEDVTVQFDSKDEVSGVRYIRYSVDGGIWQSGWWLTIAALEDHTNDGAHTVRYYAVDWAGNREPVKTCTVRIDTTAPLLRDVSAARAVAPAAAGAAARGAAASLRVRFAVADPGSARVAARVTLRDARGRVLARTTLARVRVGAVRTLTFAGTAAARAARVSVSVRDAAGFARTRTVRL